MAHHTESAYQNLRGCRVAGDDLGDEVGGQANNAKETDSLEDADALEGHPESTVVASSHNERRLWECRKNDADR